MTSRAVVFDFNGTLSHDEPLLLVIFQELFAEYGPAAVGAKLSIAAEPPIRLRAWPS